MMHWILLALACDKAPDSAETGDSTPTEREVTGDPETVELAGSCPMESDLGGFQIADYSDYGVVQGQIHDAVLPISVLTPVGADGDCRLLKRENPFCEGGCASDETCNLDGECVPYPLAQDVGQVELGGLDDWLRMDPVQPGNRYFDTTLPLPLLEEGILAQLWIDQTPGPLDLHGVGVAPLVISEDELVLTEGEDLIVSWTAADSRAQVSMSLRIDQHGASPVDLRCTFDDDGEGVVPAALIDSLIAFGVTGFPNASVARETVDSATFDGGCVDLQVASFRSPDVRVAGFIPCTGPQDCPEGLECNLEIEICE